MKSPSLGLRKFYERDLFFPSERRMRDIVLSHLRGKNVLDVGCGNGWLSLRSWQEGFHVYSLDIEENQIKESSFLFKEKNADIALTQTSLLSLPFIDSFFDSILCISVLEHIADVELAVLEMKRVLKEGGRLIVVVPNGLTFGLFYDKFVYKLVPTNRVLSGSFKATFSLDNHEISMLNLNKKEPIGHQRQFTFADISKLLISRGFRIVTVVNSKFLSPFLRSFCALIGSGPMTAFEEFDDKIAENIPHNLATEWAIICEKHL